ncbi:MAG: hypothetical protein KJ799_04070 [Bacteroidetes bacterium]|nr:hypothetical protein [Bacteroidota bacterium]MBU1677246.1 hypothetical protein [Bacteroidota bacterium]MBU2505885.1 hypothetical protein [Bacteroidota bacterium]
MKKACCAKKEMKHELTEEKHEHGMGLSAMDKNKDGKVFQCPMVCTAEVTDEEGRCPVCEMKTKEVSLEKAEKLIMKKRAKSKRKK